MVVILFFNSGHFRLIGSENPIYMAFDSDIPGQMSFGLPIFGPMLKMFSALASGEPSERFGSCSLGSEFGLI
jgi:hypothetical protein